MSIQISFAWPWLVFVGFLIWSPLCFQIGQALQREEWIGVFLISVFALVCSFVFAIGYTLFTIRFR